VSTGRGTLIPAISLFTGAGGMDYGFSQEGFDVRVAVELDPVACATLRENWPTLKGRLLSEPLEAIPTERLLDVAGLGVGEVGLVFGGPPCQPFCVAGPRLGMKDPRAGAVEQFCRVVREAQPLTFCLENVPGALDHGLVDLVCGAVNEGSMQYEIAVEVLNAAEYGVPQLRRRLFIVGWRGPGEFYFPAPTHQVSTAPVRLRKKPSVGVGVALQGLPDPEPPLEIAQRVAATIPARNRKWYGKS
jgi:DNA (cytosine-5)-methyltransferase 1